MTRQHGGGGRKKKDRHKYHTRLVAKCTGTIKNTLNKVVPKRSNEMFQVVIYSVPLPPCKRVYIGEMDIIFGKNASIKLLSEIKA